MLWRIKKNGEPTIHPIDVIRESCWLRELRQNVRQTLKCLAWYIQQLTYNARQRRNTGPKGSVDDLAKENNSSKNTLCKMHTWWLGCGATIPAWGLSVASASRAAVTSLVRRAITRHAASCWYKAWLNSCKIKTSACYRTSIRSYNVHMINLMLIGINKFHNGLDVVLLL